MSIIALSAGRRTIVACEGASRHAATAPAQISFWIAVERVYSARAPSMSRSATFRYMRMRESV